MAQIKPESQKNNRHCIKLSVTLQTNLWPNSRNKDINGDKLRISSLNLQGDCSELIINAVDYD
jgi:hypothetical protein